MAPAFRAQVNVREHALPAIEASQVLADKMEAKRGALLDESINLGVEVMQNALECSDGSITWGRGYTRDGQPVADAGIFNGRCGEAIFFSALFAATRDRRFEQTSLAALRGILEVAQLRSGPELRERIGIGLTGVGSMIYALVRVSEFLDRPDLRDHARVCARWIDDEAILDERDHGVLDGSAGAVLGLLALTRYDDGGALSQAVSCARNIVRNRRPDPVSGYRAWTAASETPRSGFAHGSTGIAHALLQVASRASDRDLRDAALEAFAFERTIYRDDEHDWPDHRGQARNRMRSSWCHGAVGVGLSRLCALAHLDNSEIDAAKRDLTTAVETACTKFFVGGQSLCCGSAGRLDLLLECGLRLRNDRYVSRAYELSAPLLAIMARRERSKRAATQSVPRGPGLWQGLAGVGYTFLRLSDPSVYPSILALDQ